jgi:hypothetical protein
MLILTRKLEIYCPSISIVVFAFLPKSRQSAHLPT